MENKPATKGQLIASYGNKASLFEIIENNAELDNMARDWEAQKTELRGG